MDDRGAISGGGPARHVQRVSEIKAHVERVDRRQNSVALLERNSAPTELEIRQAISGNLCRCTGYVNIVKSIQHASAAMREANKAKTPAEPAMAGRA